MIKVTKKNEVYLKIDCDPNTGQELNEFFSFEVPGAKFTPKYRARQWDGKIRLYNMYRRDLYVGLLPHLKEFSKNLNYKIEVDIPEIGNNVSEDYVKNFSEKLQLQTGGKDISAFDHQIQAVRHAIREGRTLLVSPTASGKSLIIYLLIRYHQKFNRKQLVIVPTTSLVEQMYDDFKDYSTKNGWNAEENCHPIHGGREKSNQKNVVISTWQSIHGLPKDWFDQFDVIYGDEAHGFKAKSLTNIMEKSTEVPYKIGTTGTLDGTKTNKLVLEGLFGSEKKVISTKELMDKGAVAELDIVAISLDYSEEERKKTKGFSYAEEIFWLINDEKRNKVITNLTKKQKGNTMVLFREILHGKALYASICRKCPDRKVFLVYGDTDTAQREKIRKMMEKEKDAILVASMGTFSTGINIKSIRNIIFARPTKSRIAVLQSIGRGLRKMAGVNHCTLYDIGDDLQWKSAKNHTLGHMVERIKTYNEQHFNYKLVRVPMYE